MGCACKVKATSEGLTDKQKLILAIMHELNEPSGCKIIAAGCGLESKAVSCQLKSLQGKGFVDSPARCLYAITAEGRSAVQPA